jgi:alpha-1,6-mannosyltransferase
LSGLSRGHSSARLYTLGGGLLALTLAGLLLQLHQSFGALILTILLQGALYLGAVACIRLLDGKGRLLPFVMLIAFLIRLGPLLLPPYLSTDIYRYVWDGRVQGAGINPYRYAPADAALASLRDDAIYPNINRVGYAHTIYPPAAQIIYFLVTRLGDGVLAMKLAMLAFDFGTIWLLLLLLRRLRSPPEQVLIYAWHPLTIWEIAGSGHIDSALCFTLALAFWMRAQDKSLETGVALAIGALIKLFPLALLPALYRRWDWRLPAVLAAVALALYLPYLTVGWRVLGFLPDYVAEERFTSGSGFYLLNLLDYFGLAGPGRTALYIAFALAILSAGTLKVLLFPWPGERGFVAGSVFLSLLLVILITPHYSWYFLWLLPALCLVPYWPALILTAASPILYATLNVQPPLRDLATNSLLYVPFLLVAAAHLWARRSCRPVANSGAF